MNESTKPLFVSPDMTIEEIFENFPEKAQKLAQEMSNAGLHCVGCSAATWETLEVGMLSHGKNPEEVVSLVDRLNKILKEKMDTNTITITKRAAQKYREILKEEGKENWGIRFTETAGGCGGYEYILDYSEKAKEHDQSFISEGIEIHIPESLVFRLLGSEIDYVEGLNGAGFKVSNPNVKSSCHCGSSHSY